MSDARLRELERAWRETGATADRAAWLKERVRTGALRRERLALAAHLGDEAARGALGGEAPPRLRDALLLGRARGPTDARELPGRWQRRIRREHGLEVLVRVWIALGRAALAEWAAWNDDPTPARWLAAAEARLRDPAAPLEAPGQLALDACRQRARVEAEAAGQRTGAMLAGWHAAEIAWEVVELLAAADADGVAEGPRGLSWFAAAYGVERTEEIVRSEVVPWALGVGPLEPR